MNSNFPKIHKTALVLVGSIAALLAGHFAQAATFTWDGGGVNAQTLTPENWVGDLAPTTAAQDIVFSGTSPIGTAIGWDLSSSINPRTLVFDATALAYSLTGATTIQFTQALTVLSNDSASNVSIANAIHVFSNNTKTFSTGATANGTTLTLGAVAFRSDTSNVTGQNNQLTLSGSNNGSITTISDAGAAFVTGANRTLNKTGSGTWTVSGVISGTTGTTGTLVNSNGGSLVLAGANTYGGLTTINSGGIIRIKSNTALGNAGVNETQRTGINSGGALEIEGSLTVAEFIRVAGTGIGANGAIRAISGTTSLNAQIAMEGTGGATVSFGVEPGAVLKVNRLYSDPGRDTNFEKVGAGTLVLKADTSDDYIGNTLISAGTLQVGDAGSTGELKTAGVTNNASLVFKRSNAYAYSGAIAGSGGLRQEGSDVLTLSGANTYTGATTVNSGTLLVTGSIAGSTVTVNSTATLGGGSTLTPGVTGPVNVNAGGTIAPGTGIGTLNTGALSLSNTATYALEINTASATTDLVAITGNLSLASAGGAVLTISDLSAAAFTSGTLTFMTYTGTWDGNLFTYGGNVIADGGTLTVGANSFTLDYDLGGNSVALLAVPEPTVTATLLGSLGMLLGLRRRRASSIS